MHDSADPILQKALIGPISTVIEYLKTLDGVKLEIVARLNNWDDSFDRRVNALLHYKLLRDSGVKPPAAKVKVATIFNLDLRTVEALVRGSGGGNEKVRREVERRLQQSSPYAGGIPPAP